MDDQKNVVLGISGLPDVSGDTDSGREVPVALEGAAVLRCPLGCLTDVNTGEEDGREAANKKLNEKYGQE